MSITSRIERMFGRTPPAPPALNAPAQQLPPESVNAPVLLPMSPPPDYQQWYDRDAELLNSEKESLNDKGFPAECTILPNGKACFTVTIGQKHAALICGYVHPIEPITVQLLDDVDAPSVVDELGRVDLFAHDGFTWNINIRLGEVAQRVATLLSVASTKSSAVNMFLPMTKGDGSNVEEEVEQAPSPEAGNNSIGLRRRTRTT